MVDTFFANKFFKNSMNMMSPMFILRTLFTKFDEYDHPKTYSFHTILLMCGIFTKISDYSSKNHAYFYNTRIKRMLEMSQNNCNTILTQPTLANLSGAQCSQSKSSFGDYSRTKIRKNKIQYNIYVWPATLFQD